MKLAVLFLFIAVVLAASFAAPGKGSTKPSLQKKACNQECGQEYTPVCGGDGGSKKISFGSECVLNKYNCEQSANLRVISKGECPGSQGVRLS